MAAPILRIIAATIVLFAIAGPAAAADRLLALSWQSAFCETRPNRPECRAGGIDAARFTLHGLWPQPQRNVYCGVSRSDRENDEHGRWSRLPEPKLSAKTRRALGRAMPGARSNLHRHQWVKHGTCSGMDADAYFQRSIELLGAVNDSGLADAFERAIGDRLSRREAEQALGSAGKFRMSFVCGEDRDSGRTIVTGVRLAIDDSKSDLEAMLRAGGRRTGGCRSGVVDPPGDQ